MNRNLAAAGAVLAYAAAIYGANALTEHLDMVHVAPGMTVTAGTFAAGAALLLRDIVQELLGWVWVLVGIAAGALLTLATSPALAIASAVAFLFAELADTLVYTRLRDRGWTPAALASGFVGALVDTLLFLRLSPYDVTTEAITGQMVGKFVWACILPVAAVLTVRQVRRAVPRHSLGA